MNHKPPMTNRRCLISPNFEIGFSSDSEEAYLLEFPSHIHKDCDGDPHLDIHQIIELRYLLDQVIANQMEIL